MLVLQFVAGALILLTYWTMGNKSVWGPRTALVSQAVWILYCVLAKAWGLLPSAAVLTVVVVRNLVKWEREAK